MLKTNFKSAMKLLSEEREALRSGQLAQVTDMAEQKVALMRDLTALRLSAKDAEALRDHARDNAKLLQAAMQGVAAARERLAALRAVRQGLNIYTAQGAKQTVAKQGGGLEHKA